MRTSSLVREACRDLIGGVTAAGVSACLLGLLLGLALLLDAATVNQLTRQAHQFRDAGASIIIISAPGRIDGPTCEALSSAGNVQASGAIRPAEEDLVAANLPRAPLSTFDVSPSMPELFGLPEGPGGLILSDGAAETLGRRPGEILNLTGSRQAHVSGIFPWDETDGRRPGFGFSALVPAAQDGSAFDECWADIWPASPLTNNLLRLAVIPSGSEEVSTIAQLNASLGQSFSGGEQFSARITRWTPLVVALTSFGMGYWSVKRRRLELASDLHSGVTRADLAWKLLIENGAWVFASLLMTVPIAAIVIGAAFPEDRPWTARTAIVLLACGTTACLLGGMMALSRIREGHLAQYFRQRRG